MNSFLPKADTPPKIFPTKEERAARASAKAGDAAVAMADHEAAIADRQANPEKLRALRLARDANEQSAATPVAEKILRRRSSTKSDKVL